MRRIVRCIYLVMTRTCPDFCDLLVRSAFGRRLHQHLWSYSIPEKVEYRGATFWLPKNMGAIPVNGHYLEDVELDWVLARLNAGDVCVDVGANIGYWACILGLHGFDVHAFEPCADNYRFLRRNIIHNKVDRRVLAHKAACGDKNGSAILNHAPMATGHTLTAVESGEAERVDVVRMDSVVERVDFAKIDAEGWEAPVLRGMGDLIKKCSPRLLVELSPKFLNVDETLRVLAEYGYNLYNITHDPIG